LAAYAVYDELRRAEWLTSALGMSVCSAASLDRFKFLVCKVAARQIPSRRRHELFAARNAFITISQ
jgi:hypothetical protein